MRQYNLSILKPPVGKSSTGSSSSKASMSYTSAANSLDLLRRNLQRSINQEIKSVITKYIEVRRACVWEDENDLFLFFSN